MRILLAVVIGMLIGLPGCDTASSTEPDLGDPYVVEMQPAPLLDGDVLRVTVSYSGGCADHTFELAYSATGSQLWLQHDANGDLCEAYLTQSLDISVPAEALDGRPAYLYISETETIQLMESLQ